MAEPLSPGQCSGFDGGGSQGRSWADTARTGTGCDGECAVGGVNRRGIRFFVGCALIIHEPWTLLLALASDSVGQPLIIPMIIQTILLYPSGAV